MRAAAHAWPVDPPGWRVGRKGIPVDQTRILVDENRILVDLTGILVDGNRILVDRTGILVAENAWRVDQPRRSGGRTGIGAASRGTRAICPSRSVGARRADRQKGRKHAPFTVFRPGRLLALRPLVRRLFVAVSCGASLLVLPSLAHARDAQVEIQGAFDLSTTWIRSMPHMVVSDTTATVGNRTIGGAMLPQTGSSTFVGAGFEVGWAVNDRIVIPGLGLALGTAVGSRASVLTSVDGSMAELRPWTAYEGDVLLPGLGLRVKDGRWMYSGLLRTGVSIVGMNGSVAYGTDTIDISGFRASFLVRAQFEACRRLDPLERICLVLAPSVYQFGFLNGGTASIRWEVGP